MDWVTFLKVMIEDEKAAIKKYELAAELADSAKLQEILERLKDEEDIHIDLLKSEIKRLEAL